jgi:hypothetical protein
MTITLEQLSEMVADLAEEVATGQAGHIRPASQNKALAVLNALRPPVAAALDADQDGVVDLCGRPQDKTNDDSFVCVLPKGHSGGHRFGPKLAPAAA